MLTQQINTSDVEAIFGLFVNDEGGSMAVDTVAAMDDAAADGIKINQANTNFLDLVLGIMNETLADGGKGYVQTYGFRDNVPVLTTDTSQAAGLKMIPVAAQDYIASSAVGDGLVNAPFVLMESVTTSTGTQGLKVFIRCN